MYGIQQTQPHEKTILYEIPYKPWGIVGANIFSINNNTLLCIVNYYSKFPVVKKTSCLSADNLIRTAKIVLAEFGLQ